LTLHVDQKERVLSFEPDLCYQVYFVPLAGSNIREYFLVEQVERFLVNILTDIRKKQIQKFNEERRDQFFEDPGRDRSLRAYIMSFDKRRRRFSSRRARRPFANS